MIVILKMIFDLSFYFSLGGYYLYLFSMHPPSALGGLILLIALAIYFALSKFGPTASMLRNSDKNMPKPLTILCCALPALFFATGPPLPQIVHFLPAWAYLAYSLCSGRIGTSRIEFDIRFGICAKALWLVALGLVFFTRVGGALSAAIPYFILFLTSTVCLKRILRENGGLSSSRNVAIVAAVLVVGVLLFLLQAPQLVSTLFRFFIDNVVYWVLLAFAHTFGWLGQWLISLVNIEHSEEIEIFDSGGEVAGSAEYMWGAPVWLQVVFGVAVFLIIALVLYFIIRILIGLLSGKNTRQDAPAYSEQGEWLHEGKRDERARIFRPKDPRLAVRWYYRKYLVRGLSKGAELEDSDTSLSVMSKFGRMFPENEERELRRLYTKARYSHLEKISKSDSEESAKLWRKMKQ